ncbi:MAG: hypothetical protein IJE19_03435 [Clostridia bacterium]|nr:hypothetical protein [Clostridia bacterium]
MDNTVTIPTKTVLHFDKKFNLLSVEEETEQVEISVSLGRLLLKMLGTTPEEVLDNYDTPN